MREIVLAPRTGNKRQYRTARRPGTARRPKRSSMLIYGRGFSQNENDKRYLNLVYTGTAAKTRSQRRGWCLRNTQVLYGGTVARARARTFVRSCCIIHECTYKPLLHRIASRRASLFSPTFPHSPIPCVAGRAVPRAAKNSTTRLSGSV